MAPSAATATYKAYTVTELKAKFQPIEKQLEAPPHGHVVIAVKACGVCHSDSFTKEAGFPGLTHPRIPGHEIAGVIHSVGEGVKAFKEGDRVGVGWYGSICHECKPCRNGNLTYCLGLGITGITFDGGYAEYVTVSEDALAPIPDKLSFEDAAPLMCAGVTVYNALRKSAAKAGDLVAVQASAAVIVVSGIGGLGHLAVQFARAMGFHTIAIARGESKRELALKLGAHEYLDSNAVNAAEELQKLGGATVIITTVTSAEAMTDILYGLGVNGSLVVVGASHDTIQVPPILLISNGRSVVGHASGHAGDIEDTLAFAALAGVRPANEVYEFDQVEQAYARMMSNDARFRVVLSIDKQK
eukprot:jgi/Chlat1/3909/Chrsp26S04022